ncbi:MAG: hypothetical protein AAF726_07845 [Planctomycetota bacterium]
MIGRTLALAVIALAGIAVADDANTAYERTTPRAEVRVEGRQGDERIDVTATRIRFAALMRRIGRECNREVVGLDLLDRDPEITAKLEGERLRDALRFVAGSVGLRAVVTSSQITIDEDLAPYPTRSDLYARAATGYLRALIDHPKSSLAPAAAWNRARIEQATPGRDVEAARAFDEIVDRYDDSDLVPAALLQAGLMFGRANAWDEAVARFDALASLPVYHGFSLTARRHLADAHTRFAEAAHNPLVREENARRALHVLDALDDVDPTDDRAERRERLLVRSRALSLAGEPLGALRALDLATRYGDPRVEDPKIAELRAIALERAERHAEAVRAWLRYGTLVEGDERVAAYQRAAASANAGREHITAIAIAESAANEGYAEELAPYADAARVALDLDAERTDLFGDRERIARGERLAHKGFHREAIAALRPVFERRLTLPGEDRARLAKTYARELANDGQTEEAVAALRASAGETESARGRRSLYVLASELLEAAGEIDRAIAALEGRL